MSTKCLLYWISCHLRHIFPILASLKKSPWELPWKCKCEIGIDVEPQVRKSVFLVCYLFLTGVIVGLLIIVIIFVVVVRWRRRKRRERLHQAGAASNRDDFFNCDDLKRSNKMKNMEMPANMVQNIPPTPRNINPSPRPSPRPPPVPNRPASYTPSTADSVNTLNNFDTVCNYGSAGDELENIGTLQHIEIPEFLQNLDIEKSPTHIRTLPPPPHGPRVEDAQQKSSWDHNNPNIAQNYPYGKWRPGAYTDSVVRHCFFTEPLVLSGTRLEL